MSPYSTACYLQGAWQVSQFPSDAGAEVAFAGRSNSGKSSAINAITGRQGLARASKTPGRTQLINFFEVSSNLRLVDLPGYGFAKVPPQMKQHWHELVDGYLTGRASLAGLIVVMDARHPLSDFDLEMLDWARTRPLRSHVLLSKADKLTQSERMKLMASVKAKLGGWSTHQLFSATAKLGVTDARKCLDDMLGLSNPQV